MKLCPKCDVQHNKPGVFCSRSCANSRIFSEDSRRLKSESQKLALAKKSPNERRGMLSAARAARIKADDVRRTQSETETLGRGALRRRIKEEQAGKCLGCGITDWMGKPLILELDHIDGDNKNNIRSNLRMHCPNCHSQTPTWRGRKNGCIAQW